MGICQFFHNFQAIFWVGMTLALRIYIQTSPKAADDVTKESGDRVHFWTTDLGVTHSDYARSLVHRLAVQPALDDVTACDRSHYRLHDRVNYSMVIRVASEYDTIANTNLHHVTAWLDDRLPRQLVRVLAVGLHPGEELHCQYDCTSPPAGICSSPARAAVLLSGNHTDYSEVANRKSLMDVIGVSCLVPSNEKPKHVTVLPAKCGYAHNKVPLQHMDTKGVVTPPYELGLCVRPLRPNVMASGRELAYWIELLRALGANGVHLYGDSLDGSLNRTVSIYIREELKLVYFKNWAKFQSRLEPIVADELAVNHCILTNMLNYRHILVTSPGHVPYMPNRFNNLQQLVRDSEFQAATKRYSGYRIQSSNTKLPVSYLIRSRNVLAAAANHFVSLTKRQNYRLIDRNDVEMLDLATFKKQPLHAKFKATMERAITSRV